MKLQQFLFALLLINVSFGICFSQETNKPLLLDEQGEICSESIAARLDSLINSFQQSSSAKIYLIFYGGQLEGRNLGYLSYYSAYIAQHNLIKADRIVVLRGENQKEMKAQFWIVPQNAEPPKPEKSFVKPLILLPTQFDRGNADADRWFLDSFHGGFGEWGCLTLNSINFANYLLEKPNLKGYVVIYTAFGKGSKRADKVAHYALRALIQLKIPRNRLKTVYGGSRKEPEIEFWLMPADANFAKLKSTIKLK